jgi:hypothetical protein
LDTRKATALIAASVLTVTAGSVSLAVDLGLFRTAGAAALAKPAALTEGPGSATVVKLYKDVIDPAPATTATGSKAAAVHHPTDGDHRTSTSSSLGPTRDSATPSSKADASPPQCAEPADADDHVTSNNGGNPADQHAKGDDSGERGPATSSTTETVSPPAANHTESCDESTGAESEDMPTTSSSGKPATSPGGHRDR